MPATRVLLAGAGHANLLVLADLCRRPDPTLDVTVVSPETHPIYTGMLPGVVAGHYPVGLSETDVPALAARAHARFEPGALAGIDLQTRIAQLADGTHEPFDVLALDVGTVPDPSLPGASQAIAVKPPRAFLAAWRNIEIDAAERRIRTIAVVGGGAAGVEMILAMQYRLASTLGDNAPRFVLLSDQAQLLPSHARNARRLLGRVLVSRGIVVRLGTPAIGIGDNAVVTAGHSRIAAERIVLATSGSAPAWLRDTGLACDDAGLVRIDARLQSVSHPFVFAVGDCAVRDDGSSRPGGARAVREARPLAENLRRYGAGRTLVTHRPLRTMLALVGTADCRAVASWGPLAAEGTWAWKWKDRLDRRYVGRFRALSVPR